MSEADDKEATTDKELLKLRKVAQVILWASASLVLLSLLLFRSLASVAHLGDFLGGIGGAAGLALMYVAVRMQSRQLELQRQDLDIQWEELREGREVAKQQAKELQRQADLTEALVGATKDQSELTKRQIALSIWADLGLAVSTSPGGFTVDLYSYNNGEAHLLEVRYTTPDGPSPHADALTSTLTDYSRNNLLLIPGRVRRGSVVRGRERVSLFSVQVKARLHPKDVERLHNLSVSVRWSTVQANGARTEKMTLKTAYEEWLRPT